MRQVKNRRLVVNSYTVFIKLGTCSWFLFGLSEDAETSNGGDYMIRRDRKEKKDAYD